MVIDNKECFKNKAIEYFKNDTPCVESLIRAAYDCGIIKQESDIELITQIASPFSGGKGPNGCICGSIVGAQMIVGCIISRDDVTFEKDSLKGASEKIVEEFKAKGHVACCRAYLDGYSETPEEKLHNCSNNIFDVIDIIYDEIISKVEFTVNV